MKIAIVDYNAGNVASVRNALDVLGFEHVLTRDPKEIIAADKVIFPGQGRARPAMEDLRASGLDKILAEIKAPFLGICLGMQLLFEFSEEDRTDCLGILRGKINKFSGEGLKVPQMGWNTVMATRSDPLLREVPDVFYAYFANSYYAPKENEFTLGRGAYGAADFAAMVKKDNFYGTQFHPEKSGKAGMRILKNFCELGIPRNNKSVIIPAIDIMDGKCVRLYQGDYDRKTVYGDDPAAVARSFASKGANYLHVVDLDGAKQGSPVNTGIILRIAKEAGVPIQAGGGVRTSADAKAYLDAGVERVIIGTSALGRASMIEDLVNEYGPQRIAVSVDLKGLEIAIRGWQEVAQEPLPSFLGRLSDLGITTIVCTDIKSDGTLGGPNYVTIEDILARPFKIIVAGGVTTPEDIKRLEAMGAYGVIVGRAAYEGRLDLKEIFRSGLPAEPRPVKPQRTVARRIIACMDVADGRVVKGTHFTDLRDAGDPVELGKLYSDQGADELVFLDINATIENRKTLCDLVGRVARNIDIPFTVGGGVGSIEDMRRLLDSGADKVSVGSAAVRDPDLIEQAAREFGSQCIVVSVDAKREGDSWMVYAQGGRQPAGVDAISFCADMEKKGAGELLVNSLDRDGTGAGYDIQLLEAVSRAVSLPVIASSGAGLPEHFFEALTAGGADAALAATLFHYRELGIPDLKQYLSGKDILIRT